MPHHIQRGLEHPLERVNAQPVPLDGLHDGPEPRPDISVQGQGVVDEVGDAGLDAHGALRHHRFDHGAQRPEVDGMAKWLGLDRKPPRREYDQVIQNVPDAAELDFVCPDTLFQHLVVRLHIERPPQTRGLHGDPNHRVLALCERLHQRAITGDQHLRGRGVIPRIGPRRAYEAAADDTVPPP